MKVLVVGGGGREHALAWKLKASLRNPEMFVAPGNAGTAKIATNVPISSNSDIVKFAKEEGIDLVVVGPEAPLSEGIVDDLESVSIKAFGPSKAAAELEASKSFSKEIMEASGVPTAGGKTFEDYEEAKSHLEKVGAPIVIKADGLAAGKGVVVAETLDVAKSALKDIMQDKAYGESGAKVLIEKFLVGLETSIMGLVDGETVKLLAMSKDHKRLLDEDQGPNTGGMGAISPSPVIGEDRAEEYIDLIFKPVLKELKNRGIHYRGFLYAGVMVSPDGEINVLEFNCRMGDPETQILLPRLESDLLEAILLACDGRLDEAEIVNANNHAACVVASSKGYPKKVEDGKKITGIFEDRENQIVFQAGTRLEGEDVITKGGRVLVVTALGKSLEEALSNAYSGLEEISFDGMHFRKDIGH